LRGDSLLERQGWIRPGSLSKPIGDAMARRWVPQQIWRLLVLERWLEKNQRAATDLATAHAGQPRTY
jgi:hypothetical protein